MFDAAGVFLISMHRVHRSTYIINQGYKVSAKFQAKRSLKPQKDLKLAQKKFEYWKKLKTFFLFLLLRLHVGKQGHRGADTLLMYAHYPLRNPTFPIQIFSINHTEYVSRYDRFL